jgi:general secretion pathway protein B
MSFILDALKKSEQERERQQQPAVMDIPYGRRNRAQPLWMLVVIALLVLNCGLLLVMWWRSGNEAPKPVVSEAISSASSAAVNVMSPAPSPPPRAAEVRPLQEEAGGETEAFDEAAATLAGESAPSGPPLVRSTTALEQAMAQQQMRANDLKASSENRNLGIATDPGMVGDLPTLSTLGGSGALSLPELRLDIHVYSSAVNERFAFINSRKYTEGQSLTEGPLLEKITQEGVLLSYRGKLRLARQ